MPDQWYYEHELKKCGPVSSRQLREFAVAGFIGLTDMIWKEGVERSVAAAKVKNLFPPAQLAPQRQDPDSSKAIVPLATGPPRGIDAPAPAAEASAEPVPGAAPPGTATSTTPSCPPVAAGGTQDAPPGTAAGAKPAQNPAAASLSVSQYKPVKKALAVALRGLVITTQDGTHVQFKKKCPVCHREDPTKMRVPIKNGIHGVSFFCGKCKKTRNAEYRGVH